MQSASRYIPRHAVAGLHFGLRNWTDGRLAQRESTPLTWVGSQVQSLYRPPSVLLKSLCFSLWRDNLIQHCFKLNSAGTARETDPCRRVGAGATPHQLTQIELDDISHSGFYWAGELRHPAPGQRLGKAPPLSRATVIGAPRLTTTSPPTLRGYPPRASTLSQATALNWAVPNFGVTPRDDLGQKPRADPLGYTVRTLSQTLSRTCLIGVDNGSTRAPP